MLIAIICGNSQLRNVSITYYCININKLLLRWNNFLNKNLKE